MAQEHDADSRQGHEEREGGLSGDELLGPHRARHAGEQQLLVDAVEVARGREAADGLQAALADRLDDASQEGLTQPGLVVADAELFGVELLEVLDGILLLIAEVTG